VFFCYFINLFAFFVSGLQSGRQVEWHSAAGGGASVPLERQRLDLRAPTGPEIGLPQREHTGRGGYAARAA